MIAGYVPLSTYVPPMIALKAINYGICRYKSLLKQLSSIKLYQQSKLFLKELYYTTVEILSDSVDVTLFDVVSLFKEVVTYHCNNELVSLPCTTKKLAEAMYVDAFVRRIQKYWRMYKNMCSDHFDDSARL